MGRPLRLSKKRKILCGGKEESYERNPGGVPLVFNHKFFETFLRFKKRTPYGVRFLDVNGDQSSHRPAVMMAME